MCGKYWPLLSAQVGQGAKFYAKVKIAREQGKRQVLTLSPHLKLAVQMTTLLRWRRTAVGQEPLSGIPNALCGRMRRTRVNGLYVNTVDHIRWDILIVVQHVI